MMFHKVKNFKKNIKRRWKDAGYYADNQAWSRSYARKILPSRIEVFDTNLLFNQRAVVRTLVCGLPTDTGSEGYPRDFSSKTIEQVQNLTFSGVRVMISTGLIQLPGHRTKETLEQAHFDAGVRRHQNDSEGTEKDGLELMMKNQDIVQNYSEIYYKSQKAFHASFVVVLRGPADLVFEAESKLINIIRGENIEVTIPSRLQLEMLQTALPGPDTHPRSWVEVRSDGAAVLSSATNLNSRTDDTGMYFGKDLLTNNEVFYDLDRLAAKTLCMCGATGSGKLLPLETRIPTPTGWTTMGDMVVGQELFDEHGKLCHVTHVFDIEPTPELYRFTFDDGTEMDSCKDHLWVTYDAKERVALTRRTEEFRTKRRQNRKKSNSSRSSPKFLEYIKNRYETEPLLDPPTGTVRTTQEIVNTLRVGKEHRVNHAIIVPDALELPYKELPIDPYLLGLWLGDGLHTSGIIHTPDKELTKNWIEIPSSKYGYRVPGLTTLLRENNLLMNKHVPEIYLRASKEQRLALLQGLMDTDGTVKKGCGSVTFDNTNENIVDAVIELACSLGHKPGRKTSKLPILNGKECKICYSVNWTPNEYVFRLKRKRNLQNMNVRMTTKFRYIIKAEKIQSRPGRCIMVSSPSKLYLAGDRMIPTHNTYAYLLMLMRLKTLRNARIIYTTPKADEGTNYRSVAAAFGEEGCIADIGINGTEYFNPLDILIDIESMGLNKPGMEAARKYIFENMYDLKKGTLINAHRIWLGSEFTSNMASYLDESLDYVYEQAGIYRDDPGSFSNPMPVYPALRLKWEIDKENKNLGTKQKTAEALYNKTYQFSATGLFNRYCNQTKGLDFNKDFIIIDMANVPDEIKTFMSVIVNGAIASRFSTHNERETYLAIDEGGVYLRDKLLREQLLQRLTQGRSHKFFQWIATHQPSDFSKNGVGEDFRTNTYINILMGNNIKKSLNDVKDYFELSENECAILSGCEVGQGLLLFGDNDDERVPIFFKSTEWEHKAIKGIGFEDQKTAPDSGLTFKREYKWLISDHKIIFSDWIEGDASVLLQQGYEKHQVARVEKRGTVGVFMPRGSVKNGRVILPHMGDMKLDHYASVIQFAPILQAENFEEIAINHNQDVDIKAMKNGKWLAFEYEIKGSHTTEELIKKKATALEKGYEVRFVCSSADYPFISGAVGADYTLARGAAVADFIKNFGQDEERGAPETDIQVSSESGLNVEEMEA